MRPPELTIGILGVRVGVRAVAQNEDGDFLYSAFTDPGRFSWSISAPDIATMNAELDPMTGRETRLVTGVSEGTATVTATSEGVSGSMKVTVRDRARLAWSTPVGAGWITAGIAIGTDGTIYVATAQLGTTSRVSALSPEGNVVWTLDTPFRVSSNPAIGADGTLYIGSMSASTFEGRLTAVDPGGSVRWRLDDLDRIQSSPSLGADGTIYAAGGYHVYAVDPQGEILWAYETTDRVFVFSSPAIASDGTLYVGAEDDLLYAINPDGSLLWTFETGGRVRSSPAIGMDGTVYFGSLDGRLYAVRPDGTERWSVELDFRGISSSPSIGPDGTIYVIGDGVFAVDPGGSIRWNQPFGSGGSLATPILGADGTVYVGDGAVTALDAEGRLLWGYGTGGDILGSVAIGVDGAIIAASFSGTPIASSEGTVHAIRENVSSNGGFAGAPWPKAGANRANNGRAGGRDARRRSTPLMQRCVHTAGGSRVFTDRSDVSGPARQRKEHREDLNVRRLPTALRPIAGPPKPRNEAISGPSLQAVLHRFRLAGVNTYERTVPGRSHRDKFLSYEETTCSRSETPGPSGSPALP